MKKKIVRRISGNKKKRNSMMPINTINSNNFAQAIAASVQKKLNSDLSKEKRNIQDIKPINPFITQDDDKNQNNKTTVINNKVNFILNVR